MSKVITNSRMSMSHFHDFYFLQALDAAIKMEISSNPELQFVKAVDKLQEDLEKTMDRLIPNMALRIFMYLYAACLGEARHASDTVAKERFIRSEKNKKRSDWFLDAINYPPNKENLKAVVDVFNQQWRAGYGGSAWGNIATALTEYGTMPDAAWIDHVVDLEHNNGTAFSKPDGFDTIMFDVSYPHRFSSFLDYKFAKNILEKKAGFTSKLPVSPKIYSLVSRYTLVFKKPEVKHIVPDLEPLTDYSIEWGDRKIELEDKWFDWIEISGKNKPNALQVLKMVRLTQIYPSYFTAEEFTEKVMEKKYSAYDKLSDKATPYLKSQISKLINKYIAEHVKECKLPKAKKTYPVVPCSIELSKYGVNIILHIDHEEGYGEKVESGVLVKVGTLYGLKFFEGAYIERYYGDLVLWVDGNHYWLTNPILEALVD